MTDHLLDTTPKLAQCGRCQGWVYLAEASGIRSAADVAPADRGAYIAALTSGRRLFRLTEAAGRPHRLLAVRPAGLRPSFDESGRQTGAQRLLAEHGCGGHAMDAVRFTELVQEPPPPACDAWRANGWSPAPGQCARQANPDLKSCSTCEPPPFEAEAPALPTPRLRADCGTCTRPIKPGEPFTGVQHGHLWIWAEHEECP